MAEASTTLESTTSQRGVRTMKFANEADWAFLHIRSLHLGIQSLLREMAEQQERASQAVHDPLFEAVKILNWEIDRHIEQFEAAQSRRDQISN